MTLAIRAQRPWRIASGSHSLTGIQAAAVCGLGVSVLPVSAVLPEHSVCTDLPDLSPTELALISREGALTALQRALVGVFARRSGQGLKARNGRALHPIPAPA